MGLREKTCGRAYIDSSASGDAAYKRSLIQHRSFEAIASGTAAFGRRLIMVRRVSAAASGAAVFARRITVHRGFAAVADGAAAIAKKSFLQLNATASGSAAAFVKLAVGMLERFAILRYVREFLSDVPTLDAEVEDIEITTEVEILDVEPPDSTATSIIDKEIDS